MKNIYKPIIVGALVLSLSACGTSKSDRMLSGAGIGAVAGGIGSAMTGGNVGTGALIGGGLGAAAGGLTNSHQMNLGRPAWR